MARLSATAEAAVLRAARMGLKVRGDFTIRVGGLRRVGGGFDGGGISKAVVDVAIFWRVLERQKAMSLIRIPRAGSEHHDHWSMSTNDERGRLLQAIEVEWLQLI